MSNKNLQEESVDEDSTDSSEESEFDYVGEWFILA
tara:strand:+ start:718 stop:822 length:105 start_codon:yes stop_codon:yes gene_type:complete